MALVLKDRVKETTTTVGTGTITLAGASTGYQAFSVIGNANTTYYAIVGPSEWEVGLGTYTLSGTTLARTTVLASSTGGTAVNFSAGVKDVFVTYPADLAVLTSASQTLTDKTLTSPVINTGTASGLTLNDGYTEEVFAVTGATPALSPTNGSIQTWTLTANSTPTAGTWASGQSITLMIDDGTAYTITWTSLAVTWETTTGAAPSLATTGYTVIVLWKVNSTIYGALVGG